MPTTLLNRRTLVLGAGGATMCWATPSLSAARPNVHVYKDPDCGCCGAWAKIMDSAGFDVTLQNVDYTSLARFKMRSGIPEQLTSCHTAMVGGYLLEGHVPPADVDRLLATRPDAIGLAVPGMPYGSPGMGPESERDAYDVVLMMKDGSHSVFTSYPAA